MPHQNFGRPVRELLPKGCLPLTAYLLRHQEKHSILLPWGQSCVGGLAQFPQKAVWIAGCSTALGTGRALQIPVMQPAHATGDVDTDFQEKVCMALQAAKTIPLVVYISMEQMKRLIVRKGEKKQQFQQQADQVLFSALV